VLNNGHRRNGVTSMCVGHGANITVKDFNVFCPKAIAGIGKLPDTVADRSIPIRMKRRKSDEQIERFRRDLILGEANEIRTQLDPLIQSLSDVRPALPEQLSNRQQDGCEPLLAIADASGADWPLRARRALVEILQGEAASDDSTSVKLLAHIRSVFDHCDNERISTTDLINALCEMDPQWSEFSHGKPLSPAALARLLKRFEIVHRKLRFESLTLWGWERGNFLDAWARYLPRELEHVEQGSKDAAFSQAAEVEQVRYVPAVEMAKSLALRRIVPGVPATGDGRGKFAYCGIHGLHSDWWERPSLAGGGMVCDKWHPQVVPRTAAELGF
jgi:hypothetical protein